MRKKIAERKIYTFRAPVKLYINQSLKKKLFLATSNQLKKKKKDKQADHIQTFSISFNSPHN